MRYLPSLLLIATLVIFSCKEQPKEAASAETKMEAEAPKRPNIVVLLCDDLGYGDLSSFGHPIIQTPNLDKLAETGIKLTNFYSASPVCSPSRVGLLTGRSPNRAGVYDWIPPGNTKQENLRNLVHMQSDEKTIPDLLKSVGYTTCLVGKWHCNSIFNSTEQPQPNDFGFDHWFATHNNASPSHQNPKNFVRNGKEVGAIEGFSSQIIVDEAISWLDKKEDDNPFFLEVTFHEPHEPIASPEDLVEKYMPQAKNREQAEYFANVENVDIAVGRLIAYLEKNNAENTLIVFSSDNGPETFMRYPKAKKSYGSPGDLKGMKLWTTEAGFHVPGIIKWLGNEQFKGTSDMVVSALDFLPTFCELAGAKLPERALDGQSIASFLKDGKLEREKPLLWSFYNALNDHVVAMRKDDWKIMARLQNDSTYLPKTVNIYEGNEAMVKGANLTDFELYNLANDITESEEIASANSETFKMMKALLTKEYADLLEDSPVWRDENN